MLKSFQDRSITVERLESLLARGTALALATEKWERTGLWVITRSDPDYPSALKCRLKHNSPAVLFGCGNKSLLNEKALAVVGSRDAKTESLAYSALLGGIAAQNCYSVVSGGARGVDEAAMLGALLSGGKAIGVLADSLIKTCLNEKYRSHLMDDRLVLVSPYSPEAGFNAGNAMQRNKYIYCISSAAFVVCSGRRKGGTWNGASQNLKQRWVRLWVRENTDPAAGNAELEKLGASCVPKQIDKLDFLHLFTEDGAEKMMETLSYEAFLEKIRVGCDTTPRRPTEIGEQIPVSKTQLNAWLRQAVDENKIEKLYNPVRYRWIDPEFANYGSFLEKIQNICDTTPRRPAEIGEQIPVSKTQLNAWLKQAVDENKIEKLYNPVRYLYPSSIQGSLSL